jgi:hypothetical protein
MTQQLPFLSISKPRPLVLFSIVSSYTVKRHFTTYVKKSHEDLAIKRFFLKQKLLNINF